MNAEDQRRLHNLATIGTVTQVDSAKALMRLAVGELETDWLNIPAMAAGQIRVWRCPSVGEQFLLISPSGDLANAMPVMSIFSEANPSPSTNPDEIRIRYNDTDFCSINTSASNITLHISQMTAQAAQSITLDTPAVNITGSLNVKGAIKSDTEVTAKDVDLTSHQHSGVKSGSSNTGDPV